MMDFFSAAHLVQSDTIAVERADLLPDHGLALDQLLAGMERSTPEPDYGLGWRHDADAALARQASRASQWVSRWSLLRESVPLWQRYPAEACMVSVTSRAGKLGSVGEELLQRYGVQRLGTDDLDQSVLVARQALLAPVEYLDLAALSAGLGKKGMARNRLAANYLRRGMSPPPVLGASARYVDRKRLHALQALCRRSDVVDGALSHEAEVRLTVALGEGVCRAPLLQALAGRARLRSHAPFPDELLGGFPPAPAGRLAPREWVPCPPGMVEQVTIDPRCSPYKAQFMRTWFEERGVTVLAPAPTPAWAAARAA